MYTEEERKDVSVGNWLGTLLLTMIPIVNFIMAIVWICGGKTPSKKHYGVALLIWLFVLLLAAFVALVPFGKQTLEFFENANNWLKTALAA